MSVEIREIVIKTEINNKTKQTQGLSKEQIKALKQDVLNTILRGLKKASRNSYNR